MRGVQLLRAFSLHETDVVQQLADEYLRVAQRYQHCRNYGNAIHQANTVLGLLALEQDRVEQAERYLEASALTPGSTQLTSFGPNMLLAQKLLERGRKRVVLRYLDRCGQFWRLSFGRLWLWKMKIRRGLRPDFGANLSHLLDYKSFG
jgi:hypothetical protein